MRAFAVYGFCGGEWLYWRDVRATCQAAAERVVRGWRWDFRFSVREVR